MSDLAKRLRDEACGGSNWNAMLNGAADALEAKDIEIASLELIIATDTGTESKVAELQDEVASLYEMNLAQAVIIKSLHSIADELANVLEYFDFIHDPAKDSALAKYRETKGGNDGDT